jgi:hypothetical protein
MDKETVDIIAITAFLSFFAGAAAMAAVTYFVDRWDKKASLADLLGR